MAELSPEQINEVIMTYIKRSLDYDLEHRLNRGNVGLDKHFFDMIFVYL